jgi:hypothetical protein
MSQQTFTANDTAPTVRSKLNANATEVAAHIAASANPHGGSLTQANLTVTDSLAVPAGTLVTSLGAEGESALTDDITLAAGDGVTLDQDGQTLTVSAHHYEEGTLEMAPGEWWLEVETSAAPLFACAMFADEESEGGTYDETAGAYYDADTPADEYFVDGLLSAAPGFRLRLSLARTRTVKWRAWLS